MTLDPNNPAPSYPDPIYPGDPTPVPFSRIPTVAERRPSGVILAAITLGFASLGVLLMAGISVVAAVAISHSPGLVAAAQAHSAPPVVIPGGMPGAVPPAAPPSATALVMIYIVMAVIALGLAAWGITTVVGLLRLKQWARISIMIQGGLVAICAGFFTMGAVLAPIMMKSMQMPSNVNPSQMHIVFAAFALISGLIALIGVWWIVYFALRGPREAFAPTPQSLAPGTFAPRAIAQPIPIRPTGPITDFTVAQPLAQDEQEPHN